jgi:hypothetical protein
VLGLPGGCWPFIQNRKHCRASLRPDRRDETRGKPTRPDNDDDAPPYFFLNKCSFTHFYIFGSVRLLIFFYQHRHNGHKSCNGRGGTSPSCHAVNSEPPL